MNLKILLQGDDLKRVDKVVLILASLEAPVTVSAIKHAAAQAGCPMKTWNVSEILKRSGGLSQTVPGGYELSEKGRDRVAALGGGAQKAGEKVAKDLRQHLENIKDKDTRAFVLEAIRCYENDLYRSSIVMSWIATVDVLQKVVVSGHLAAFNAEAKRIDGKWKTAITADDLGRMKEIDFLDRLSAISVIGKNVKSQLAKALDLRNACGHPNSLKVSSNVVAAHLEMLLLNVFEKFNV